ncbi:hypothetical protein Y032_0029g1876 [Ancylostoma ceylanicum]|nr:hypothetical protein Y032_0029g1876 [Ancylostoma ceylanicum]
MFLFYQVTMSPKVPYNPYTGHRCGFSVLQFYNSQLHCPPRTKEDKRQNKGEAVPIIKFSLSVRSEFEIRLCNFLLYLPLSVRTMSHISCNLRHIVVSCFVLQLVAVAHL